MSTSDSKWVPFGRFGRPHGVRGEVRFWPHNPASELLAAGRDALIGPTPEEGVVRRIEQVLPDAKGMLVRLAGVTDRDAAASLNGLVWFESREAFPALEGDEYYVVDLVGSRVCTEDGRELGHLAEVWQHGPTDIFVIRDGRREHLVPAVGEFVVRVDVAQRLVVIRPVEGLLEPAEG